MRRVVLVFICSLLVPLVCHGRLHGRRLADSLLKELTQRKSGDDSVTVKLLDTIGAVYHTLNPDSGIIYANWGKQMSERLAWKRGEGKAYHALGLNYEAKTKGDDAIENYLHALAIFTSVSDKKNMASSMGNIGNVYTSLEKYEKALSYDSAALALYYEINDKEGQLRLLGNMATTYQGLNDSAKAKLYFTMAIDMARKLDDSAELAKNFGNLSFFYYDLGDYQRAIGFGKQSLAIYQRREGNEKSVAINLCNLGEFYIAFARKESGAVRHSLLEAALRQLAQAYTLSSSVQYNLGTYEAVRLQSEVHELLGDYGRALALNRRYHSLKDSVNSTEVGLRIATLEKERSENLRKIAEEKKRTAEVSDRLERYVYISGIVLLLAVMGIVIRNFVNQVKSNRQLSVEKNQHLEKIKVQNNVLMTIAQVQSHELRGPVSTILGLSQLFNHDNLADPVNKELIEGIQTLAQRLDRVVTEIVRRENSIIDEENPEEHGNATGNTKEKGTSA